MFGEIKLSKTSTEKYQSNFKNLQRLKGNVFAFNIDIRRFDLNYENDVLFEDKKLSQAICERQAGYIKDSVFIDLNSVRQWPLYRRLWNNLIATIGPVL